MGVTVGVNKRSVVHKDSGGMTPCFPDVCKIPAPGTPPVPFPNFSFSKDTAKGSKSVKMDGNPICLKDSEFSKSTGDEPGSVKGVASNTVAHRATFVTWSADTFVEGKNVERAFDLMLHNNKNTPPFPVIQPPIIVPPISLDILCPCCGKPWS